jgi:hypothetical protein
MHRLKCTVSTQFRGAFFKSNCILFDLGGNFEFQRQPWWPTLTTSR